jgi:hypothetical protein
MKLERTKIPFKTKPKPYLDPDGVKWMGSRDIDKVTEFIENNDEAGLNDFINNRMGRYEEMLSEGNAGLATRDYLNSLLGSAIIKKDPEIKAIVNNSFTDEDQTVRLAKVLKDKVYPGLTDNVTADERGSFYVKPLNKQTEQINIDRYENAPTKVASVLHEYGHNLDFPQKMGDQAKKAALLKLKPQYSKVLNDEKIPRTTHSEGGRNNPRIPNFEDYDWTEGEFNSDWMRDPLNIQDQQAKEHHIRRNYPLDNLKNFIKGGYDEIVESKPDKFNKLKKLVSV